MYLEYYVSDELMDKYYDEWVENACQELAYVIRMSAALAATRARGSASHSLSAI
jgi:hypothetical protein